MAQLYVDLKFDMPCSFLTIIVTVPPSTLNGLGHPNNVSATLQSSQTNHVDTRMELSPPSYYRQVWYGSQNVEVASNQLPLELTAKFWSHGSQIVLHDVKTAIFCGIPVRL